VVDGQTFLWRGQGYKLPLDSRTGLAPLKRIITHSFF